MPNLKVEDLLNHIQELVGEPVGGYYNISTRLKQLNQAQREMVQDTRALVNSINIAVDANQSTVYLPDDFLTYAKEQPYFTDSTADIHKLQVVDLDFMDETYPTWREGTSVSTPMYLVMTGSQQVDLYPLSAEGGTLTVPYVVDPDELVDVDDEVFNGVTNLNRYAFGLAYKVAAMYMMPRAPQLGQQYLAMYNRELRQMRQDVRSNPQHTQTLRPKGYPRRTWSYWSEH